MNGFHTPSGINGHLDIPALILSLATLALHTPKQLAPLLPKGRCVALRATRLIIPRRLKNRIHQLFSRIISARGTSLEYGSMTMLLFFQFR